MTYLLIMVKATFLVYHWYILAPLEDADFFNWN